MTACAPAPSRAAAPVPCAERLSPSIAARLLRRAAGRIAPVWPLETFVAVNPFLGLADHDFRDAAHVVSRVAGARTVQSRGFYADAIRSGRVADRHLAEALRRAGGRPGLPADAAGLREAALAGAGHEPAAAVPTVASVVSGLTARRWDAFVTDRISAWASAYFDAGQASWGSPWRHLAPHAAWRAEATLDRTSEIAGISGFRALAGALPEDAAAAASHALARLGVPAEGRDLYLHGLASSVAGWTAFGRYRGWGAELAGGRDDTAAEIVAIRLAWEAILLDAFADAGAEAAWAQARAVLAEPSRLAHAGSALDVDLVLHEAFEIAYQEDLAARLGSARPREGAAARPTRPDVQAVFCIDVRSEVFRRALEAEGGAVETLGFAGFFGFALEYVPLGAERGGARCPVLLTPAAVVAETVGGTPGDETARAATLRNLRRRAGNAWRSFKSGAVSCFAFVGPVGLAYARNLVTDSFGLTRPAPHPATDAIDAAARARLGPTIEPAVRDGRRTGLTAHERLDAADKVLRAMSLTDGFARIVLLAGHGATTANNAHAAGLDCGACGGHAGDANARVAVAVLNDAEVRRGLAGRGVRVPDDTVFVAGLHDTTTDEVTLFDTDRVPATHEADLARLRERLAAAGRRARDERAPRLGVAPGAGAAAALAARSRDWSEVRPEWGLAGCAAFVAAPRSRTVGVDLAGRAFLHSYDWRRDEGFAVLELILTAPVVVASWISLQYLGSSVDGRAFGSGNKTLHNVTGTIGVLEGNGGDLRTGLPFQSVHDGERLVHEPLRLSVIVEAPIEAVNGVLAKHDDLRRLVDHGWVRLFALGDDGRLTHRYVGGLAWSGVVRAARPERRVPVVA
jgi:uncharacterized protein YbcC (UPF0753/DUF2309 family)